MITMEQDLVVGLKAALFTVLPPHRLLLYRARLNREEEESAMTPNTAQTHQWAMTPKTALNLLSLFSRDLSRL